MSAIPRPFTILGGGSSATGVTSSAVIADNVIVRGDGGARGVQGSVLTIADTTGAISGFGTGAGLTFHGGGTLTGASGALTMAAVGAGKDVILVAPDEIQFEAGGSSSHRFLTNGQFFGAGASGNIFMGSLGPITLTAAGTDQHITLIPSGTGYGVLTKTGLGTTSSDGWVVQNTTDAAASFQQIGPRIGSWGEGWKTDATAASVVVGMGFETLPVEGAAAPTATMRFFSKIGAGAVTYPMTLTSVGLLDTTDVRATQFLTGGASTYGRISSPSDGVILFSNNAGSGLNRQVFGTNDTSGVGLVKSTTTLALMLGDGTAGGCFSVGIAADTTTKLALAAGTTGFSSLRVPHGSAPTSPVDGDVWTTTAGLFVRVNGSTVGPLS